jgi:hypothetical protein
MLVVRRRFRKKLFQATHGHTSERNFASVASSVISFAGCIGKGNRSDFGAWVPVKKLGLSVRDNILGDTDPV